MTKADSLLRVDTRISTLRLRSEPKVSDPVSANVIAQLPDGHLVRATAAEEKRGFLEVQTTLDGAQLKGFASAAFLVAVDDNVPEPARLASPAAAATWIIAVGLPRKAGAITRRKDIAGVHPLNEPNPPGRRGANIAQRHAELHEIIAWLAVDNPAHRRYKPRGGATFCNIYCHDYCHLAGVYLPRTWWSATAIAELSRCRPVAPLIENTVYEMRANGLFHWLREFGPGFGWQRAGSLDELQQEANRGAVGMIIARRKENGRPGHITVVAPETDAHAANRDKAGEVTSPLQSQAGASNFRYGIGRPGWWKREQFADFAFWLHP